MGRRAKMSDFKCNVSSPIHRIERGGEITWHGKGQIVGYPLLDLRKKPHFKKDLHWYLRHLETMIINVLSFYKIKGYSDDSYTGVWVNNNENHPKKLLKNNCDDSNSSDNYNHSNLDLNDNNNQIIQSKISAIGLIL